MRPLIQALWSHWRQAPLQLVTLIGGLALATALWSGVQAINAEARASYDAAATTLGGPQLPQLAAADGAPIRAATFAKLRRAGWAVSPVLEGRIERQGRAFRLIGFDPLTAPRAFAREAAPALDASGFFLPPYQMIVSPQTAAQLSAAEATLIIAEAAAPGTILTDIAAAQEWLEQPGRISRLVLDPSARPGLTPWQQIAPQLTLHPPQAADDLGRLTDSFHLNLTAFGLLSFAVGLFIVQGTISLAFEQRRTLFRTLRALGVPLRRLLALLVAELAVFALLAGGLGMVLGYGIAAALLPDVAATLRGLYGAEVDGSLSLRLGWWLSGMAIALLGTGAAAGVAVLKVARMPLLAPAQPRAWARMSERSLIWLGLGALGLAALAAVAVRLPGLVAGFTFLGAMLIAGALCLPLLLFAVLRAGQALARGPIASWAWADTRQQLPGLSLALMALLLALATNVGVGTMVSSFRLAFTGYLDQRLSAELYVTARDEAEAAALGAFLARRADAVLPIWSAEARIAGRPAEIFGIVDHATYRENWPILAALPDVWDRVAAGEGILINEQLSRRQGLSPGAHLDLPGGWRAPIAGVYSDYGNPGFQVLIAQADLEARFQGLDRRRFGLRTDDPSGLARALTEAFGLPPDQIIDQASIKAFSLQVFERTFTVTAALNVLTLSVAGFAILTSLLTLAALRPPQLAPVWALGMTRRSLAGLELLRALGLATLVMLAAVPLGLLLAWALLAVINVEAFGWRLPMRLFPADWLWLWGAALLAALLAAAWPALRLARTPPAELLKVFAHAR